MTTHKRTYIKRYEGKTFVGFIDISGFKNMMEEEDLAKRVLSKFYSTVYEVGKTFRERDSARERLHEVNAIVVSDCAVVFSRNENPADVPSQLPDMVKGLRSILEFIKKINQGLIGVQPTESDKPDPPIMTTCSIAYGKFKYENRIGFFLLRRTFS